MTDLLATAFDLLPENAYLLIHTIPEQRPYFFKEHKACKDFIKTLKTNVYLGCGFHNSPLKDGARGERNHIAGIFGLWADVDVKLEKNFFRRSPEALDFLDGLPLKPTIIIHTGGGFHSWWLFKEAWIFENEEERNLAETYTNGWIEHLKAASGKDLDSVGDLPRVLRVPGTVNYKPEYNPPRKVKLEKAEGGFYTRYDFDQWLAPAQPKTDKRSSSYPSAFSPDDCAKAIKALEKIDPARCDDYINEKKASWIGVGMALYQLKEIGFAYWNMWSMKSAKYKDGDCEKKWRTFATERENKITLASLFYWAEQDAPNKTELDPFIINADATGSFMLIDQLCEENPKFKKTWLRKRTDFDGSQLEYDRSLISFGVQYDLSNQVIVDMLITHRKKHGQPLADILKKEYAERHIRRARETRKSERLRDEIREVAENYDGDAETETKADILNKFSVFYGINMTHIIKYRSTDGSEYKIKTADAEIMLGDINGILIQQRFRSSIADISGVLIPIISGRGAWDPHAQLLLKLCENEDGGHQANDAELTDSLITAYLSSHPPTPFESLKEESAEPNLIFAFHNEDQIFLNGPRFQEYLMRKLKKTKMSTVYMGRLMSSIGAVRERPHVEIKGHRSTLSLWKLPRFYWLNGYREE